MQYYSPLRIAYDGRLYIVIRFGLYTSLLHTIEFDLSGNINCFDNTFYPDSRVHRCNYIFNELIQSQM
jgi:hypothetical protein